jgi:hypothetical protein
MKKLSISRHGAAQTQNTFRPSDISYSEKDLVRFDNKSQAWKENVEINDRLDFTRALTSIGIFVLFLLFVLALAIYINATARPEPGDKQPIVKTSNP